MVIENVSLNRRQFLGGIFSTGAFVVASRLVPAELFAQGPAGAAILNTKADTAALHPSVYLGIEPDGTVFIVTHRSEMGTGIRTSLPLVAADELARSVQDVVRVRLQRHVDPELLVGAPPALLAGDAIETRHDVERLAKRLPGLVGQRRTQQRM